MGVPLEEKHPPAYAGGSPGAFDPASVERKLDGAFSLSVFSNVKIRRRFLIALAQPLC
jgi:hypothetical protein